MIYKLPLQGGIWVPAAYWGPPPFNGLQLL